MFDLKLQEWDTQRNVRVLASMSGPKVNPLTCTSCGWFPPKLPGRRLTPDLSRTSPINRGSGVRYKSGLKPSAKELDTPR